MRSCTAFPFHATALSLAAAALLVACGGGGDNDDDDTSGGAERTLLSGVASSGDPIAGARIAVVDSDPATADPAPVTAGADGRFTVDVSGQRAPLAVQATGSVDGAETRTIAVVPSLAPETTNTANVTPLTHAVAALIAPQGDPAGLLAPAALAGAATPAKVSSATALVVNTLKTEPTIASALGNAYDPLTTPLSPAAAGVLKQVEIGVSSSGVTLANRNALLTGTGSQAVLLTSAQTATPGSPPELPKSAAPDELPGAADLAAIASRLQACLALPASGRVTLDPAGSVSAVSAACNLGVADWRSNGRNWAEEVGENLLARGIFSGAKVGAAVVDAAFAADNVSDPRELKRPYCDTSTCVSVRFPLTTASNQTSSVDWVLARVNGVWSVVGNQRPYRAFLEARLNRKINVNRGGPAAGNTTPAYYFSDRYESALRVVFDLRSGNTQSIRAVRVRGPGLPAAGLVLLRSQRCGTDDRMAITFQTGSTMSTSNPGTFAMWTPGSDSDFILDAANMDGTPLAMPVPVNNGANVANQNFAPAPVPDLMTAIPAWSRYSFEVFRFDTPSETPDEIFYARIGAAAENASQGTTKPWPTLAPATMAAYLSPTGSAAGALNSLAHTLNWTSLPGTHVNSGYLFGQNFLTTTNSQGESANYGLRTRLDFEPTALGDTSAPALGFASVVSGTSMSGFTANSGTNPNPRCTSSNVVTLSASINDYREIGLSFRGADRKLYNAIWLWDN